MSTVLVLTTEVASLSDDFHLKGNDIPEQYVEYDLNEWDNYAVEAAVQASERDSNVEVVSATNGPQRSEETIRMVLAMGADRAIRVWDEALDSVELLDVATKVRLLSAVVKREDPDLVLTGVQSADDSFGATPVAVAEEVGFEWAAVVNALEIDWESGVADIRRELEGGIEELMDVDLPAVLSIQTGINEPRYASLRGIRQAQRKTLDVLALDDLGMDAAAIESTISLDTLAEPESESDVTLFEGDAETAAVDLADAIREMGVVQNG